MKSYDTLKKLGEHLQTIEGTLCLLGLGSMADINRLDEYSDIDFFLIVKKGYKKHFIDDLSWININILYAFKNTNDGYKVYLGNDVFAEFAIFEPDELSNIAFDKGKVIFAKPEFDLRLIEPKVTHKENTDISYHINEALTNLYIGLLREKRGEKASAFSFIQVYAASHVMVLFKEIFNEKKISIDPFSSERRIEFRYPEAQLLLSTFKQGYAHNTPSALAIIEFLHHNFSINEHLYTKIISLINH